MEMKAKENVIGTPKWYTDTTTMPSFSGLLRRGNSYSIRRKVPFELQKAMGRREIKRALGTANPQEAKRRAAIEWIKLDALFEKERERIALLNAPKHSVDDLSEAQRWEIVARWFGEMEERSAQE